MTDGTTTVDGATQITVADATVSGTAPDVTITPNPATADTFGVVKPDGITIGENAGVLFTVAPAGAEGDLWYYHDGAWHELPVGSAGQILTVVSGDPKWGDPVSGAGAVAIVVSDTTAKITSVFSGAAPTGWYTVAFDDSGWPNAVIPTCAGRVAQWRQRSADLVCPDRLRQRPNLLCAYPLHPASRHGGQRHVDAGGPEH